MNSYEIKDYLRNSPNSVEYILSRLGFTDIQSTRNGGGFRCSPPNHTSPNGVAVTLDSLYIKSFTQSYLDFSGDIIELVKYINNCDFNSAMKFIHDCCGLIYNYEDSKINSERDLFFGGFFELLDIDFSDENTPVKLTTYDESILDNYTQCYCERFLKDNISAIVQRRYGICFDEKSNRIVVPWRDWETGKIIGLMGRINMNWNKTNRIAKWLPVDDYSFQKKHTIYGFYENKNEIIEKGIMFVGESEKFPMQLSSMESIFVDNNTGEISYKGINNSVALGSHNLSNIQVNIIHSISPKNIIVCFDEDVSEEEIIECCKKLKSDTLLYSNNVGYIYDRENKYLPKGSKASPSDFGKEIFAKLIKDCLFWI